MQKVGYPYTGIAFIHRNEWNADVLCNVGKARTDAQWNKSVTKGLPHPSIYTCHLENTIHAEWKLTFPGAGGELEVIPSKCQVSVWGDEEIWNGKMVQHCTCMKYQWIKIKMVWFPNAIYVLIQFFLSQKKNIGNWWTVEVFLSFLTAMAKLIILVEGRFYCSSQPDGAYSLPWWGRGGGGTRRQLLTRHSQSGSRDQWTLVLSSLSPLPSVMGWCCPQWHVFLSQFSLSGNTITDVLNGVSAWTEERLSSKEYWLLFQKSWV